MYVAEIWRYPVKSMDRFDVLLLSIVSEGTVRALAVDRRRLRPNIVVGVSTAWRSVYGPDGASASGRS